MPQDTKNKFSAVVDVVLDGTPQEVARHGKQAVFVLSVGEYRRLIDAAVEARECFADHLLAFPGGQSQDSGSILRNLGL